MLENVLKKIDEINSEDPNKEVVDGKELPKELVYGQRMTEMLGEYDSSPSEEMQIAARGQHIRRWDIQRSEYPMGRAGYFKWRTMVKIYHGELLSEIMEENGYSQDSMDEVVKLVTKKKLKTDEPSQQLEDVICLVFLKYYFHEFAKLHQEEKVIDIVRKTWGKMTEKGHEMALKLEYVPEDLALVQKALS
ncbi:DUF4202 domain-containing protein [Reichenbachiella versicolor]|uniref:DUF4202 domain-containing protein n=1 Tax=Reichenbachiella versicolor TaxID=1821036 RepID=UPI00293701CF|nr:DUF4202 domain-containing protein [Reichenbachiella versicolor]